MKYQVVDEYGKVLEEFRNKQCAKSSMIRLRLNKYDKLEIKEKE